MNDFLCPPHNKELEVAELSESYLLNLKAPLHSHSHISNSFCQAQTLNSFSVHSSENEHSKDFNSEMGDCYMLHTEQCTKEATSL